MYVPVTIFLIVLGQFLFGCLFIILFIYLFGCIRSSLLGAGFLQLWPAGDTLRCDVQASHYSGFPCCEALALGMQASVVAAHRPQNTWVSIVAACGLSSCGTRALLLRSMWDLPGPGIEPVSPSLAGVFLTTAPPGKSETHSFEGISLLWPSFSGKAIKLFLSTSPPQEKGLRVSKYH